MALNTEERQDVTYFTGVEVEHTIAHGLYTLFVVGTPDTNEILYKAMRHKVKQIYFGTSQSFNPESSEDWEVWDKCIKPCLENTNSYFVTLDFDLKYAETILEYGWNEYNNFIPMVSVKMPYLAQFNYNTTVKIDDKTWGYSNPGVWTHQLHDLCNKANYTHWGQYTGDTPLSTITETNPKFLDLA